METHLDWIDSFEYMILFSLRCLFFVHNLYKLININLIIIISISFLHKSSHLCLCYLPCKSRFYLSLHFYKTHYHAIPGSNQIFQHWAGSRKKSDTFAQKYMMQIENNACTRHLRKSTYFDSKRNTPSYMLLKFWFTEKTWTCNLSETKWMSTDSTTYSFCDPTQFWAIL